MFKWNVETDGNEDFDIEKALNDNWDNLDTSIGQINTEIDTIKAGETSQDDKITVLERANTINEIEIANVKTNLEQAISQDTDWQPIALEPGFSNGVSWCPCRYRKIEKIISIIGYVKGFSNISYTKFGSINIPNTGAWQFVVNVENDVLRQAVLNINSSGELSLTKANFTPTGQEAVSICCTIIAN